jgi:hypothetical protein
MHREDLVNGKYGTYSRLLRHDWRPKDLCIAIDFPVPGVDANLSM